jgi:hypothetical protein
MWSIPSLVVLVISNFDKDGCANPTLKDIKEFGPSLCYLCRSSDTGNMVFCYVISSTMFICVAWLCFYAVQTFSSEDTKSAFRRFKNDLFSSPNGEMDLPININSDDDDGHTTV